MPASYTFAGTLTFLSILCTFTSTFDLVLDQWTTSWQRVLFFHATWHHASCRTQAQIEWYGRPIWPCFSDPFYPFILVLAVDRSQGAGQTRVDPGRCLIRDRFQMHWCSASLTAHGSDNENGSRSLRGPASHSKTHRSHPGGPVPSLTKVLLVGLRQPGFSHKFPPQTLESYRPSFYSTPTR